jgi:hypothetical protein
MNETILKNIESMTNPEELREYLVELKNRGVLTLAEVNRLLEEYAGEETGRKLGQRTPDTMEYAYSNVSAGFSSTAILGLLAMSAPAIVAMINILKK